MIIPKYSIDNFSFSWWVRSIKCSHYSKYKGSCVGIFGDNFTDDYGSRIGNGIIFGFEI